MAYEQWTPRIIREGMSPMDSAHKAQGKNYAIVR